MVYLPVAQRLRQTVRQSPLRRALYAYHHRHVRETDVALATYARSGSTWTTFMLVELLWRPGEEQGLRDARYAAASVARLDECTHFLPNGGRVVRTHERYHPSIRRAICVTRDPRDAAVSLYFQVQRTMGFRGAFSEFLSYFYRGAFTGAGRWDEYVASWQTSRASEAGNVLWIRYEDLHENAFREVRRAADFLEIRACDEEIRNAVAAGRFELMRRRELNAKDLAPRERAETIHAVRKGVVGDWTNHFGDRELKEFTARLGGAALKLGYRLDRAAWEPTGTASATAESATIPTTQDRVSVSFFE